MVAAWIVEACVGDDPPSSSPADGGASSAVDGSAKSDGGASADDDDDDGGAGADVQAPRCSPLDPWGEPVLVGVLNQPGVVVGGARLSADRRTIYYSRRTPPTSGIVPVDELFFATRPQPDQPFSSSTALLTDTGYNKRAANPIVTIDQKTLFFNTTGIATGATNIAISTRVDPSTLFTAAGHVTFVSGPSESEHPYINQDGSRLYYASNGTIYVAKRSGGVFDSISTLLQGSGSPDYSAPVVSSDELAIWVTQIQSGVRKIAVSTRNSLEDAFGLPAIEVAALNAHPSARPTWISDDGCELYLTAAHVMNPSVDAGYPETHIFRATRTPR